MTLLAVLTGCTAIGSEPPEIEDQYAALRGLVLDHVDLLPRNVNVGAALSMPQTGPAYVIEPPLPEDLRSLAEKHAGGPVIESLPPATDPALTGFDAGDGWFTSIYNPLDPQYGQVQHWGWMQAAWRAQTLTNPIPSSEGPCAAGTVPRTDLAAEFFERIGVQVELNASGRCITEWATLQDMSVLLDVSILVDGLPLVGVDGAAWVDRAGAVLEASGPLWRLSALGDVELAPSAEVLRRLVHGPGLVPGNCSNNCSMDTDGATLGLAYATNGGSGNPVSGHDHIPGGVVENPPSQVLVPALRVPGVGEYQRENAFQGVLAISSAALVDDPGQADAARQADATSSGPAEGARACGTAGAVAVCTSQPSPAAGTPVLLTAYGERYEPVGASGCQPLFSLDPGDGSDPQSFLPRSGTVITARVTHEYAEPGTYAVVVRSASRCSTPASPGGSEQEYDYSAGLTITVTG